MTRLHFPRVRVRFNVLCEQLLSWEGYMALDTDLHVLENNLAGVLERLCEVGLDVVLQANQRREALAALVAHVLAGQQAV